MITAIDVGGTKTLIAQFDTSNKPINEIYFLTPKSFDEFMDTLLGHLENLNNITSISLAVPCMVSEKDDVLKCGNLDWHNVPLKKILKAKFKCPVYVENDAKMAAIAEINSINPRPKLGLYLTISTGIGGGLVKDGKLVRGIPVEPGHMLFTYEGELVPWEQFASGKAIKNHFGKLVKELNKPSEWEWIASRIAVGLRGIIPLLQPDVIVIGGGVGESFHKFERYLRIELKKGFDDYIRIPKLIKAKHPAEAVIYGGFYHARHHENI